MSDLSDVSEAGRSELLRLSAIHKSFRNRSLLSDINLAIHAREIVTLIGPNGAGKTTLMRIALGLSQPDRGTVARLPGLRIGYMPQKLHVDEVLPLTVRRFLSLHRRATAENVEAALVETRADHLMHTPIQHVSGGEMQRILLARALLGDPQLLVLDEPVQGVDVNGQGELYNLIGTLRDRHGCGVFMVSHDLHMVMAATDRVICLNHHVCCSGTPEAVGQDPAFHALFGMASASFALYTHHHDHRHDLSGDVVEPSHAQTEATIESPCRDH